MTLTPPVLLRSGSDSSLSEGGDGSDEEVRSCGTGSSVSRRSSRRPSVLRRQQAVTGASAAGTHTVHGAPEREREVLAGYRVQLVEVERGGGIGIEIRFAVRQTETLVHHLFSKCYS